MSNGIGMDSPPNNEASGAVTSAEVGRKKPSQGKFKSGITRVDTNRHGIRRETNITPRKTRPKKV